MPQGSASVALLPCSWSERRDWRSGESVVLTACTFLALVISAVPRLQLPENLMHMGSRGHCTAPTGAQYSPHTCTGTYVSPCQGAFVGLGWCGVHDIFAISSKCFKSKDNRCGSMASLLRQSECVPLRKFCRLSKPVRDLGIKVFTIPFSLKH